jgi:hypothetical protein
MILVLAIAAILGCIAASASRLRFVIHATPFDPTRLEAGVRKMKGRLGALAAALGDGEDAAWERELVGALRAPPDERPALLGEAMTELDFRLRRWAKVPRVCASLGTSFAFLLATVALRVGLSDLVGALDEARVLAVNDAVLDAVDVVAVGLVGAAFCIAIQVQARRALASRREGSDLLVERLEQLADLDPRALATDPGHATVGRQEASEATPPV